jgi:hypothetical protein
MSRNGDIPVRCELGGIAIIVKSKFSINRGIIVKVIEPMGLMTWPGFGTGLTPVWRVQVLCSKSSIRYHLPRKGELRKEKIGLVPDRFLCSLTPLTGQLRFEFEDYEPEPDLEPMAL